MARISSTERQPHSAIASSSTWRRGKLTPFVKRVFDLFFRLFR